MAVIVAAIGILGYSWNPSRAWFAECNDQEIGVTSIGAICAQLLELHWLTESKVELSLMPSIQHEVGCHLIGGE